MGRTPDLDFTWQDVVGRTIVQNIRLGATAAAFTEGIGDFVQLWEPSASRLVNAGAGHVVTAMGEYSGVLPYTAFHATQTYMRDNPEVIRGFTRAIYRAQQWVQNNSAADIAATVQPSFPDMALGDMTEIIVRYKELGVWAVNPLIPREAFDHLQNIMVAAGELTAKPPFEQVVNTAIAERVINEDQAAAASQRCCR